MGYWILQSNPNKYRIFEYLRRYPDLPDTWPVSLFRDEVMIGDHAFIWVSNVAGRGNRGIYAKAEIVGRPDMDRKPYDRELRYWIDQEERSRLSRWPCLEVRYIKVFLDRPLLADELRRTRGLENLPILRMPQRGIYKLTEDEGRLIESMID